MLISPTREDDKKTYRIIADILLILLDYSKRHPSEELDTMIEEWHEWYQKIKTKVETHDYTEDDKKRRKVDNIIYGYKNSN